MWGADHKSGSPKLFYHLCVSYARRTADMARPFTAEWKSGWADAWGRRFSGILFTSTANSFFHSSRCGSKPSRLFLSPQASFLGFAHPCTILHRGNSVHPPCILSNSCPLCYTYPLYIFTSCPERLGASFRFKVNSSTCSLYFLCFSGVFIHQLPPLSCPQPLLVTPVENIFNISQFRNLSPWLL